jgi:hypothetical protein
VADQRRTSVTAFDFQLDRNKNCVPTRKCANTCFKIKTTD